MNQRKLFFLPENTAGYELRDLMADEGVGETSDMIHPLNPATQRLFGRISIESRKVGVRDSDGLVAAMGTLGGWDEPAQDLFEFISNCDGSISFRSKDGKYLVRKALDPDAPGVNKRFIERVFVGDRIDENAKWNIASLYLDKEGNEVPDGQAVRSFALEAFVPFYEMIRQPRQRRYLVPDFESLRVGLSDPYLKEKLINTLLTLERPLIRSLIPAGIAVATKTKYRPLTGFGGYGDF